MILRRSTCDASCHLCVFVVDCFGRGWGDNGSVEQRTRFTGTSGIYQRIGDKKEDLFTQFRQHGISIIGEIDK